LIVNKKYYIDSNILIVLVLSHLWENLKFLKDSNTKLNFINKFGNVNYNGDKLDFVLQIDGLAKSNSVYLTATIGEINNLIYPLSSKYNFKNHLDDIYQSTASYLSSNFQKIQFDFEQISDNFNDWRVGLVDSLIINSALANNFIIITDDKRTILPLENKYNFEIIIPEYYYKYHNFI